MAADSAKGLDSQSLQIVQYGGTLTDIAALFRMDRKEVKRKISGVAPAGTRGTAPVYHIHEVAPFLVKPNLDDVGEYIRTMPPSELPKMLTKEYWTGQRARQEYEIKAGTLWPTTDVIEKVGELLKLIKMNLQLAADAVERQVELTERQRKIIRDLHDGALGALRTAVIKHFGTKALKNGTLPSRVVTRDDDDEEI